MNRDTRSPLRAVHPATILFFILTLLYGLGVEAGVLAPVEIAIRGLPLPRWLVTTLFYVVLLIGVSIIMRVWGGVGWLNWLDAMSINRGGLGWFDALLLLTVVALVFLGWRYYGFFDRELLPIAVITALSALVGLFRSPPWNHIFLFQRDEEGVLLPTRDTIQDSLGQGDATVWSYAEDRLRAANPGVHFDAPSPGDELYVPRDIRPATEPPPPPPAQVAAAGGGVVPPPPP
jgi:hypothetical protein